VLLITTGCTAAQDVPSHTQVQAASKGGFDFPAQLGLFGLLATYSNGIIANVTKANFSNANALLAKYNSTVDRLNASATEQGTTLDAMKASRDDFYFLIKDAQRYSELYVNETSLVPEAARSNGSVANALEMRALNGTLKRIEATIEGHNADIYGSAVDNGLNLAQYGNSTALFKAYDAQVDSRFANVTTSVFRTPLLTLTGNTNTTTYGDAVRLTGSLQNNGSGLTNGSVDVYVDNTTVATVPTNASGAYAYQLPIRETAAGRHVAFVKYAPIEAPFNPAQSQPFTFSVAKSPVNNALSFLSGSIALGSNLQARGQLTTQNRPVTNATVALALGGSDIAQTRTDENGTYAFSVPVTSNYLSAVPGGVTAYTVFDPSGQPLDRATSAAVHIPADLAGVYAMIASVTFVVLLGIFLYSRGFGRRAPSAVLEEARIKPAEALPTEGREPRPVPVSRQPPRAEPEPTIDWNAARDRARDAFRRGDDESATTTLFEVAVASLSATAHVRLAAHMTYSEKFWAIKAALPDVNAPLRELTTAYELANYSGRSFTQAQRDAALSAYDSLHRHVKSAEGRP